MKTLLGLGAVGLLLGACQFLEVEKVPGSPYYMPPVGSVVRVNEVLKVPGGWARVFLQRGEVVSYGGLDRYYPSCNFELKTVKELAQYIQPGRSTIVQVRRRVEEIVQSGPVHYASLQILADAGVDGGSPSMIMRTVRMRLSSEQQPNLYMLTCRGAQDDPAYAAYVSIDEMREAMGDKATLLLPEEE